MEFLSRSPEETKAFAASLSRQLTAGDTLLFYGDLGAGKSEFSRGIARGLGITGPIPSPSFTILQEYRSGRLPLYHFDWYRLQSSEELYELGMDEYLNGDGIALVEWPSCAEDAAPSRFLRVEIVPVSESERKILLTPEGGFRALDEDAIRKGM